jgi:hypothetical protein
MMPLSLPTNYIQDSRSSGETSIALRRFHAPQILPETLPAVLPEPVRAKRQSTIEYVGHPSARPPAIFSRRPEGSDPFQP